MADVPLQHSYFVIMVAMSMVATTCQTLNTHRHTQAIMPHQRKKLVVLAIKKKLIRPILLSGRNGLIFTDINHTCKEPEVCKGKQKHFISKDPN